MRFQFNVDFDLDTDTGREEARRFLHRLSRELEIWDRKAWHESRVTWNIQNGPKDPAKVFHGEDMTQCGDPDHDYDGSKL